MNEWDRIYEELKRNGGVESSHDLSILIEVIDGLIGANALLKGEIEYYKTHLPKPDNETELARLREEGR